MGGVKGLEQLELACKLMHRLSLFSLTIAAFAEAVPMRTSAEAGAILAPGCSEELEAGHFL